MTSLTSAFSVLLQPVKHPGDFCTSGTIEIFTPSLEVESVGPVAIPCLPLQMEQLIAASAPAPYGRGEQTLLLEKLRDTNQIEDLLANVSAAGQYGMADNDAILEALILLPTLRAIALIESIITGNASTNPMACSNLLARAVQKMPPGTRMKP